MIEFSEKEFDVIGFAKNIMSEIEAVRSFEKLTDEKTGEGFQLPTESRLNAFFRLIGLPYFVCISTKDNKEDSVKFLNPGFGRSVRSELADKKIRDNEKQDYTDPNKNSGKVGLILADRTSNLSKISEEIGSKKMNERMTKAICAPLDIKPNVPDKLTGEGDFVPKTPPKGGPDTQNKRTVFKKLFPLIPSYQKVLPLRNEMARPFTLSSKERRIDRDTLLRKPFIEQVVRIRFVVYGSSQTTREKQTEADISNSIKQLVGATEFSKIFTNGSLFAKVNLLEEFVISKFLDAIKNLARRWVKLNEKQRVRLLREIRPTIAIKTSSARVSPFGKRIEVSTSLDGTAEGEKIKKLNVAIAEEEALISLLPTDENESTEPKQSETRNITPSALQNSFTELLNYNLKKNKEAKASLVAQAKKNINSLEKIRLELDLMTGEFTGISLPDIVITIAALFIMDRNKLLNLLDKYTIDSMKNDKVLATIVSNIETPTAKDAMDAIQELEKIVSQLFGLFQAEVEAIHSRKIQGRKAQSIRTSDDTTPNEPTCLVSEET